MSDPDVSTVLTSIQVDIAAIRGDLSTLRAEMTGQATSVSERLDRKRRDLDALGGKVRELEQRADALESANDQARGRVAGIALGVSLGSSALTTAILQAVTG